MAGPNPLIAAYQRKVAELGELDNEINSLDMTLPEGEGEKTFDYLAQKRTEIEREIRGMKEKIDLLSAWQRLKEGMHWSEGLRTQLDGLDESIGEIATSRSAEGVQPEGAPPLGQPSAEAPPPAGQEALPPEAPPEAPPEPLPTEETPPPAAPAPVQAAKKDNYPIPDKKGSNVPNPERGKTMANDSKTSLKTALTDMKASREAVTREAKTRVAAAWTIAKTMLPTAPPEAQKAFAQTLLANSTKALVAALKQTAVNAHYSKVADEFKKVHKVEINDLLEDPSILTKEKGAVKSEVKGDPKNATGKQADDRKDAGPQPATYSDGRGCGGGTHSEPKEVDSGKAAERPGAGERPGDTVNLSEGKSAGKESDKAAEKVEKAKAKAEVKDAKKDASAKTAQPVPPPPPAAAPPVPPAPPAEGGAPAPPEEPLAAEPPAEGAPAEPPSDLPPVEGEGALPPPGDMPPAEGGAAEMVTEEKIRDISEKVQEVAQEIQELQQEISGEEKAGEEVPEGVLETEGQELEETGKDLEGEGAALEGEGESLEGEGEEGEGEALNLDSIFNEDSMEEKTSALANEGDGSGAEFFAPSAAVEMEAAIDENDMGSIQDMFSVVGSDADPLAALFDVKTAAQVAGMDVVPSFTGEAAKKFQSDTAGSDGRDYDDDHSATLWAEVIKTSDLPEFKDSGPGKGPVRVPQDSKPKLEGPKDGDTPASQGKAAAKPAAVKKAPATLKRIKPVIASDKDAALRTVDIADALFGDSGMGEGR